MEKIELNAELRAGIKPAVLRKSGIIPAVVYGKGMEPISIQLNNKIFVKLLGKSSSKNSIISLNIKNSDNDSKSFSVLAHDLQINAITDAIDHVDFLQISMEEEIKVKISISVIGESLGVKLDGGILVQSMRFVEVKCLPTNIPDKIEVDVTTLKIGDSIHVAELKAPQGVTIITSKDEPVVTISSPSKEEEVAPVVEAAAAATTVEGAPAAEATPAETTAAKSAAAKPDAKTPSQKPSK